MSHVPQYAANESSIAGLTQLVCLAALQVHRRDRQAHPVITKKSKCWNHLLDKLNLSQTTGPVVLAVVQANLEKDANSVKEMVDELRGQCEGSKILPAINQLLLSEVFRND